MAPINVILTEDAPKPFPQLFQAVTYGGMVYCSGSVGVDPKTWKVVTGGVKDEAKQALENLSAVLQQAGSSLNNGVKVNIFLPTMNNFGALNEVYDELFKNNNTKPARTCVAAYQLPLNCSVEIECIAALVTNKVRSRL